MTLPPLSPPPPSSPPCVRPKNLRVQIQNVPVCTDTTPACGNTCARGAGTHGGVLNLHTEVFAACQAAPHTPKHTQHTHRTHTAHTPHTTHTNTQQHTTTETVDRERKRRGDERRETREDNTKDKMKDKTREDQEIQRRSR